MNPRTPKGKDLESFAFDQALLPLHLVSKLLAGKFEKGGGVPEGNRQVHLWVETLKNRAGSISSQIAPRRLIGIEEATGGIRDMKKKKPKPRRHPKARPARRPLKHRPAKRSKPLRKQSKRVVRQVRRPVKRRPARRSKLLRKQLKRVAGRPRARTARKAARRSKPVKKSPRQKQAIFEEEWTADWDDDNGDFFEEE